MAAPLWLWMLTREWYFVALDLVYHNTGGHGSSISFMAKTRVTWILWNHGWSIKWEMRRPPLIKTPLHMVVICTPLYPIQHVLCVCMQYYSLYSQYAWLPPNHQNLSTGDLGIFLHISPWLHGLETSNICWSNSSKVVVGNGGLNSNFFFPRIMLSFLVEGHKWEIRRLL